MKKSKIESVNKGWKLHFYCTECQTIMSNENLKKPE